MTGARDTRRSARTVGRVALWGLVLLLLVRGLTSVVAGTPAPVAAGGGPTAEETGPDELEMGAFAVGFARAYLTFTPGRVEEHAARLRPYLDRSLGPNAGLELPAGGQRQTASEVVTSRVVRLDRRRVLVTVAAELRGRTPAVRYLTVPVARGRAGSLAVFDYPSFAPPPRLALGAALVLEPLTGPQRAPIERLLRRFFPVYLAGRGDQLAYFLPPGRRLAAVGGSYELTSLVGLAEPRGTAGRRRAVLAALRVRDTRSGALYLLRYRVSLERRERWYVAAVNAT